MSKFFYTDVSQTGDYLYFRGYKDGISVSKKHKFKPTLYLNSPNPTEYRSPTGACLKEKTFDSIKQARDYVLNRNNEQTPVFGNQKWIHQFISDVFRKTVDFDRDCVNVTTIDIEVKSDQGFPKPDEANHPITAITVKNNIDNIFYVWGLGDWSHDKSIVSHLKVKYVKCDTESHLLYEFLDHWSNNYPDIVTGWNSRMFDIVYIMNRIRKVVGDAHAKRMSPWHEEMGNACYYDRELEFAQQSVQVYELRGIQQLDYMDLFKKFAYSYGTQESYKLDHIASVVLGERKIDYSEYGSLNELYIQDHQKFIDYNIKDVDIVDRLEDKMSLITLCMTIAYKGRVNYSEAFSPVAVWDALIYNELRDRNIICPPKKDNIKNRQIEGAYVKDPQVGMHEWVMSFDLNSLYPHIIMQYNMSPEMIVPDVHGFDLVRDNENGSYTSCVDYLLDEKKLNIPKHYTMAGSGQFFLNTNKGLFPQLVEQLYDERKQAKREMLDTQQLIQDNGSSYELEKRVTTLDNKQMAVKILMNSLYGAMSNQYFRYYDMRIAEGITISGQLTIRWAEKQINEYMNKVLKTENEDYVIAIDTDSLYIRMGKLVEATNPKDPVKFLDRVAEEKIEPLLNESYNRLRDYLNAFEQKMVMSREVIASKGVWTGKKHYVLNVHNSEGVQYKEPKLKMMGIEAVRSSTPAVCRDMFKDVLKVILEHDEQSVQKYLENLKEKFKQLPPEDVAFPRSVNLYKKSPSRAYNLNDKGLPIQVRAALTYNHYLKERGIENKYEAIHSGEKIKFCYLRLPNRLNSSNVIAFPVLLPEEFGVREHVDYETQFNKAFLEPVKSILDAVGWEVEKTVTIEDFFG